MLFKIIVRLYKVRKQRSNIAKLNASLTFGESFCGSKLYESRLAAMSRLKVTNMTGDKKKIVFGDYCNVQCQITLNHLGSIQVGNHVFMNYVRMRIDHDLRIGDYCLFGPNVTLWDTSNHPVCPEDRMKQALDISKEFPLSRSYESKGANISIGENVWIGMESLILGGVNIGDGAVIAARSVVTSDVPPRTLVAGSPARVIRTL